MANFFGNIAMEKPFAEVLHETQQHISNEYATLISGNKVENKAQIKNYIKKFLEDAKLSVAGMSKESLTDRIYMEMVEYSFLTSYLHDKDIEEINVNSWEDIKIHKSDGTVVRSAEKFNSPVHALDVVKRLLHSSGMVLDSSQPVVRGYLDGNIRITASAPPVIDKEIGVTASIRLVNPKSLKKKEFIEFNTASEEMLDLLSLVVRRGASIGIGGSTGSGKTTLMSWLMEEIIQDDKDKRLITIENDTREYNLIKKDENGEVSTNVIHYVTRKSSDPKKEVDQEMLLEYCLTLNPDVIVVSEMKGAEAFAAQEAARTGHVVLTTTHCNSCLGMFSRMTTLCRMKYEMDFKTTYELVTEAYPISAYMKKIPGTSKRKITEIAEMMILPDGTRELRPLWKYKLNTDSFEKVNGISPYLQNILRDNFASEEEIKRFL